MDDVQINRLVRLLKRKGPCRRWALRWLRAQSSPGVAFEHFGEAAMVVKETSEWLIAAAGGFMEDTSEMLKLATDEVAKARNELREVANEIHSIGDIILPTLTENISCLRSARMGLINETVQSLGALREVRKFFLESDYRTEVERLREFLSLCDRMKQLKVDGTLDVISDVILKLAIGGDVHDR